MRKVFSIVIFLICGNIHASFPGDFPCQAQVYVSKSYVDASLTSFTVILTSSMLPQQLMVSTSVCPSLSANGGDIRFSTGTNATSQIPCDVRTFSANTNITKSTADIAVKLPTVSMTQNTTFYVWWGMTSTAQPVATDTYGQYAAYDGNYMAVWAMQGNPGINETDRSSNGRTATNSGSLDSSNSTLYGIAGKAVTFPGSGASPYYDFSQVNLGTQTVTAFANSFSTTTLQAIVGYTSNEMFQFYMQGAVQQYEVRDGTRDQKVNTGITTGAAWTHLAFAADKTALSTAIAYYVNGTNITNSYTAYPRFNKLGGDQAFNNAFNGIMDEVHISSVKRAAAWVKAEASNLLYQTAFATNGNFVNNNPSSSTGAGRRRVVIQ